LAFCLVHTCDARPPWIHVKAEWIIAEELGRAVVKVRR
jgi:hypothetical protein